MLLVGVSAARAQVPVDPTLSDTIVYGVRAPRWAGHLTIATTNVLFSGLTAGVVQELRGGSFKDGFTRGALGGVFAYTGKRVAAQQFDGAGLIGRHVSAVGSSIVRNASYGRATFAQLDFPLGPVRVQFTPETRRVTASLDVIAAAWITYAVAEPELKLSIEETLSAGAPVFQTDNRVIEYRPYRSHAGGYTAASVILQSYVPAWGQPFLRRVLAHERVHVGQEDQLYLNIIAPIEEWLLSKVPAGSHIDRAIDLNFTSELLYLLIRAFPRHADRPWELEAFYLSR